MQNRKHRPRFAMILPDDATPGLDEILGKDTGYWRAHSSRQSPVIGYLRPRLTGVWLAATRFEPNRITAVQLQVAVTVTGVVG